MFANIEGEVYELLQIMYWNRRDSPCRCHFSLVNTSWNKTLYH